MCVVDGVTAAVSIVPAETGPLSPTSHISYTLPCEGGGTLFSSSMPAFLSRENTTVALPPATSAETDRTSGAAMICSAVAGVAGGGRVAPRGHRGQARNTPHPATP